MSSFLLRGIKSDESFSALVTRASYRGHTAHDVAPPNRTTTKQERRNTTVAVEADVFDEREVPYNLS